jgi:hypothetical protein
LDYVEDLWSSGDAEWSHGVPGTRPSPTGSYAVVRLHEALRNAWPLPGRRPGKAAPKSPGHKSAPNKSRISVSQSLDVTIQDLGSAPFVVDPPLGPKLFAFFLLLARRRESAGPSATNESRSLTTQELADASELDNDSVRTYVKRTNEAIQKAARLHGTHIGDLVQRVHLEEPIAQRRWALNVDAVDLHPSIRDRH